MFKASWQITTVLLAFCEVKALGATFAECNDQKALHTFVASYSDCARYIYCDGAKSFEGQCIDDDYFNEKDEMCDDPDKVNCVPGDRRNDSYPDQMNPQNVNSTDTPATTVSPPPNKLNATQVPQCPSDINSTAQLLHLPNPSSCSSYYTCYNGIAIAMVCARQMYFNPMSGKCERQENVNCQLNRPVLLQCGKGVYEYIPHPRNCEYYYYCANGFLMILQCPFQFTWHYERRACVHQSQSKCYSNSVTQEKIYRKNVSTP